MQAALQWFALTHDLLPNADGTKTWHRTGWPAAGGAGDQGMRLVEQLTLLRQTFNDILRERAKKAQQDRELDAWRRELAHEA